MSFSNTNTKRWVFFLALTSSFLYQGPSVGRKQGDTLVGNAAPSATARGLRHIDMYQTCQRCRSERFECFIIRGNTLMKMVTVSHRGVWEDPKQTRICCSWTTWCWRFPAFFLYFRSSWISKTGAKYLTMWLGLKCFLQYLLRAQTITLCQNSVFHCTNEDKLLIYPWKNISISI